jgi:hypothetical protein
MPVGLVVAAAVLLVALAMPEPAKAAFPGKNGKITFVRGTRAADPTGEIYVIGADGSGQTRLTNNTVFDGLPAFSHDGKRIAFTSRRDVNDEIYVMDGQDTDGDGNGDDLARITNSPVNEFQPAFSPDGEKMAFTSNQTGDNEVYVMDADGTDEVRLTNNAARDARPAFAPGGDRIAFTSNRDGDDEIYVMDAQDLNGDGNGDNLTKLTDNPVIDTQANFSPDGKGVVFTSRPDGNDEIYVMNSDGSGIPTRLTNNPAADEFPTFSPDGKEVAFSSNREGNFEIYVVDSDGSGVPKRLTYNLATDSKPDWGPLPDSTPPSITLTRPADGAAYTLGQLVNAEYSCQDEAGGSGLASCIGPVPNGDPIDTTTVGPKRFTVEATDNAGNAASESHSYSVLYAFGDFYEPVDNPPITNVVRAGSAIPVKFSLGGDQGLDIFATGYPHSGRIPADPGAQLDNVEQTVTAGASSLTYDPATAQHTYVWKTDKAWAGQTRQLVLKLKDGSEHQANFEFK